MHPDAQRFDLQRADLRGLLAIVLVLALATAAGGVACSDDIFEPDRIDETDGAT